MNRKEPFYLLIYDFEIRTNFTLSSSVSFITGTYIRCNTCSTILAIRIANSWNNQVMVTSFCLHFWFKIRLFHFWCANPSNRPLNFNNKRKTVRVSCTIFTYRYISCPQRFEPLANSKPQTFCVHTCFWCDVSA